MKAMVRTSYGGPEVFYEKQLADPTCGPGDLVVRVHASSVNYGDLVARDFGHVRARDFNMPGLFWLLGKFAFGFTRPKNPVLGNEFSGVVETVGVQVTAFAPGDRVFGHTGPSMGAYASHLMVSASGVVAKMPEGLSMEVAAALPYGGVTAFEILSALKLQPGQSVAVVGATGSIGAAAVQWARAQGAVVTAVCGPKGREFARRLGAEHVVDYTQSSLAEGQAPFDVILDVLGKGDWNEMKRALKPQGRYVVASFKLRKLFQAMLNASPQGQRLICALAPTRPSSLHALADQVSAGTYVPYIDKVFDWKELAEAHRYAETRPARGGIVVRITPEL